VFSTSDTIVAIATPAGRGGLGVIRLSGPAALRVAGDLVGRRQPFQPRLATFSRFVGSGRLASPLDDRPPDRSAAGRLDVPGDHVVVTCFPSPASYTGEDVAEISAHGSPVVLSGILRRAVEAGARLAEPGEFTLRAFVNGKLDLIQAEAVADLIDAVTPAQARAAFDQLEGTLTQAIGAIERDLYDVMARLEASLDFPDEGYHFVAPLEARDALALAAGRIDALLEQSARGRLVRDGAQVAIVGAPNVGKSSLFNTLLNANRAIVTAVPGTTRDLLTEHADIRGLSLALVDTAGVRDTEDEVEREGVSRTRETLRVADLVLVVLDRSRPLGAEDLDLLRQTASQPRVLVWNKCDLPDRSTAIPAGISDGGPVWISARTGEGLDRLIDVLPAALGTGEGLRDTPVVTNVRHSMLLANARAALTRATAALEGGISEEFPLLDLQEAAHALQEITGRRTSDDLLRHIFERFCIGK
jgi:tRNA modification GTPase